MTGENAPSPLVATASDIYSGGYEAWRAFDETGGDGSRWHAASTVVANKWIQIDFGTAFDAVSVALTPDSVGASHHPVDFEVWGSSTGAFAGEQTVVHAVVDATTGWAGNTSRTFQWESFVLPSVATIYAPLTTSAVARRDYFGMPTAATVSEVLTAVMPKAQGDGRLSGTVKVLTAFASREVRLHDRRTGELLRVTTSAPSTGAYAFERLQRNRPYLVVALDDTGQPSMYNAAVADMLEAGA